MRRLFNSLKERIGKPPASKPIPIPTTKAIIPTSQQLTSLPPPLPPRRERSKSTLKPIRPSPSYPQDESPNSLRDSDMLLVHTPSLSSFTHSPRMTSYGLDHGASPATSIHSSLSRNEPFESDLASSTTTMNLASLSHNLPIMLDHTPSLEETSIYQYMENSLDHSNAPDLSEEEDDQSDTSNESIYIKMSAAKGMDTHASMISGSESQNDLDFVGDWTSLRSECPIQNNPSYLAFETITNS